MSGAIATPEEVLDFWFTTPPRDERELMEQAKRWMEGGAERDAEVQRHFATTVEAALKGQLDGWASTSRGRLALILVLDQLTRNCFRGEARTYAGDEVARAIALGAIERGEHLQLPPRERVFLWMPLLHAEDVALQHKVVAHARSVQGLPRPWAWMMEIHLQQAEKYLDVITRFGRFPHRNELLGRTSTAEEQEFLKTWAQRAPPRMELPAAAA